MRTTKEEKDMCKEFYASWSTQTCHDLVFEVFMRTGNEIEPEGTE